MDGDCRNEATDQQHANCLDQMLWAGQIMPNAIRCHVCIMTAVSLSGATQASQQQKQGNTVPHRVQLPPEVSQGIQ